MLKPKQQMKKFPLLLIALNNAHTKATLLVYEGHRVLLKHSPTMSFIENPTATTTTTQKQLISTPTFTSN